MNCVFAEVFSASFPLNILCRILKGILESGQRVLSGKVSDSCQKQKKNEERFYDSA
jgi:hypothetical protein